MRVLVLTNFFPPEFLGGYEIACAQASGELARRGHEVRVLTSAGPPGGEPAGVDVSRLLRIEPIHRSAVMGSVGPVTRAHMIARGEYVQASNVAVLAEELRRFRPDVAYLFNLTGVGGLGLVGALRYLGVPWVWHLADCVPALLASSETAPIPGLVHAWNRHVEGTYVACSRRVVDEIQEVGIDLGDRVEILPLWVDGPGHERTSPVMPDGTLRLVTAGALGPHKGLAVAVEAMAELQRRGVTSVTLDAYGPVSDQLAIRLVHRHGLAERVRLRGTLTQAELVERLREHDAFVFPTWEREPFGMAPLEAAHQGCPPIITASTGIGEFLVDGVHCLKVARSAPRLADLLERIISTPAMLADLTERAQRVAATDFALPTVFDRIEPLLAEEAARPPAPLGPPEKAIRVAQLAESLQTAWVEESTST